MTEVLSPFQVKKMFERDFIDMKTEERPISLKNRRFLSMAEAGIYKTEDGQYERPLSFRKEHVQFSCNGDLAVGRLEKLKRKNVKRSQVQI